MSKDDRRRRLGSTVFGELSKLAGPYGVQDISLDEIDLEGSRFRTRSDLGEKQITELANSIRSEGLINPVIVRRKGNKYELISGFRRVESVRRLGETSIKAAVVNVDDGKAFMIAMSENLKRKNLTPIEIGLMCDKLVNDGKSYDEVGRLMGLSAKQIQRYVRSLKLGEEVRKSLNKGEVSFFTALEIGKVDGAVQSDLLRKVLKSNLSTRDVAKLVKDMRKTENNQRAIEDLPNVKFRKGQITIMSPGDDLVRTLKALLREAEKGTIQRMID